MAAGTSARVLLLDVLFDLQVGIAAGGNTARD